MTTLLETPVAPLIAGSYLQIDSVTKTPYIQLGYPDKPSTPPSLSDMAYLADKALGVRISSSYFQFLNFNPGEHVQLTFKGKAFDGSEVSWSTAYTGQDTVGGDVRTLYVPSNIVKSLAGRTATLEYVVRPAVSNAGDKVRTSLALNVEIRGLYLPAPDLLEAIDDTIDPDRIIPQGAASYVTVSLDYPEMALGDTVRLVREGVDAGQTPINFTDKDRPVTSTNLQRRPMKITWSTADLKPLTGGVMTLYYKVYRDGVWYGSHHRVVSVGPSLAGLPPFIDEVVDGRLDPDLIPDSINVHIPSAGTLVKDKVLLFWSDTSKQRSFSDEGLVTAQNVDGDMYFDVYLDNPIEFNRGKIVTVFYVIERILSDGRKVSFRSSDYQFFVGNQKDQEAADSRVLAVPVVEGVNAGVLDAAKASSGTKITVPYAETQEWDSVTAYWQAAEGGEPVVLGTQAVDAANVDLDLQFDVPAETVKAALNKKALVYYVIERKGLGGKVHKFRSQEASFAVGPQPANTLLPAPFVPAVVNQVLDPMTATSGTSVIVNPYPGIAAGDKVKLFWLGVEGAGTPVIPEQIVSGDLTRPLQFSIPASAIGFDIGALVWVYYQVTRSGVAQPLDSEDTVLDIALLGHDDLAAPTISQAPTGVLDLAKVQTDISVAIKRWPFMAAGQRLWLRLEGVAKDGTAVEIKAWTARELTDADVKQDLLISISRAEFNNLMDGSQLKVFAQVTHDGDFSEASAEAFPVPVVQIRQAAQTQDGYLSVTPSEIALNAAYPKPGSTAVPAKGSSYLLTVSGGKMPYRFVSSNAAVAEVDANGLVMARGNGSVLISVTDASGQVVYVQVYVQGIVRLEYLNFNTYTECKKIADSRGLVIPPLAVWQQMRADGGGKIDISYPSPDSGQTWDRRVWASDGGLGTRKCYFPDTGQEKSLKDLYIGGETAYGFGMKM
jgi:hypothetical protein